MEFDTALISDRSVEIIILGTRNSVAFSGDRKLMQVSIGPAHRRLQDVMQLSQCH